MIDTTIASSGGTYTSWQGWNDGIANTDNETGTCTESANLQTTTATFNAANSGGRVYTLTAASSNKITSPTYAQSTGKARCSVSSGAAIVISRDGFVFDGVSINHTNGAAVLGIVQETGNFTLTLKNCGFNFNNATYGIYHSGSATWNVVNCFFVGGVNGGVWIEMQGGTTNIYHCSLTSSQSPFKSISHNSGGATTNAFATAVNRVNTSNGDFSGTYATGDYNLSKDTTAPGSNSLKSATGEYTNITAGSEDLTLSSTTTYAIVNRSGFPSTTDTDIAGTSRPSTGADLGCLQHAIAATVTPDRRIFPGISRTPY